MNKERLEYLVRRAMAHEATVDELNELTVLLQPYENGDTSREIESLLAGYETAGLPYYESEKAEVILNRILGADIPVKQTTPEGKVMRMWKRLAAAAVIILFVSSGYWIWNDQRKPVIPANQSQIQPHINDVDPGSNGAVLTLANGEKIALDSTTEGTLVLQGNTKVISRNGWVIYDKGIVSGGELQYNTLFTPNGRQYQLLLADGTRVWLNAMSSIRYPTVFAGAERKVEITGETYFEVAPKNATSGHGKLPFKVFVNGMEVEVLGTHFNINAYDDEGSIKTTLVEGRVKVKKGNEEVTLLPGHQSQTTSNGLINVIKNANVDAEIAWKNGFFAFDKAGIKTVMNQIARWYDIDVEYKDGHIPNENFWGEIQRNAKLSSVLKVLKKSGVEFIIEGRKVTVLK